MERPARKKRDCIPVRPVNFKVPVALKFRLETGLFMSEKRERENGLLLVSVSCVEQLIIVIKNEAMLMLNIRTKVQTGQIQIDKPPLHQPPTATITEDAKVESTEFSSLNDLLRLEEPSTTNNCDQYYRHNLKWDEDPVDTVLENFPDKTFAIATKPSFSNAPSQAHDAVDGPQMFTDHLISPEMSFNESKQWNDKISSVLSRVLKNIFSTISTPTTNIFQKYGPSPMDNTPSNDLPTENTSEANTTSGDLDISKFNWDSLDNFDGLICLNQIPELPSKELDSHQFICSNISATRRS